MRFLAALQVRLRLLAHGHQVLLDHPPAAIFSEGTHTHLIAIVPVNDHLF
jgi:hypothetical protein